MAGILRFFMSLADKVAGLIFNLGSSKVLYSKIMYWSTFLIILGITYGVVLYFGDAIKTILNGTIFGGALLSKGNRNSEGRRGPRSRSQMNNRSSRESMTDRSIRSSRFGRNMDRTSRIREGSDRETRMRNTQDRESRMRNTQDSLSERRRPTRR